MLHLCPGTHCLNLNFPLAQQAFPSAPPEAPTTLTYDGSPTFEDRELNYKHRIDNTRYSRMCILQGTEVLLKMPAGRPPSSVPVDYCCVIHRTTLAEASKHPPSMPLRVQFQLQRRCFRFFSFDLGVSSTRHFCAVSRIVHACCCCGCRCRCCCCCVCCFCCCPRILKLDYRGSEARRHEPGTRLSRLSS